MRFGLIQISFVAVFLAAAPPARADDAGEGGTNGDSGSDASAQDGAGGNDVVSSDSGLAEQGPSLAPDGAPDGAVESPPALACGGGLCDTSSGSACSMSAARADGSPAREAELVAIGVGVAFGLARRKRVRGASPTLVAPERLERPTR